MIRVLLISEHSLFAEAIEGLLHTVEEIDLLGRVDPSEDPRPALARCRPDVVLLHCSDRACCPGRSFTGCLWADSVQCVLCVSSEDNSVLLLRCERHVLHEVRELVAVLAGRPVLLRPEAGTRRRPGDCPQRKEGGVQTTDGALD